MVGIELVLTRGGLKVFFFLKRCRLEMVYCRILQIVHGCVP